MGTITFSMYLLQEFFLPELKGELARGSLGYLQQAPWNLLAILVCACASRYLIEIPMTRLGRQISASPLALPRAVESSPAPS
jgi:peptidoglycan/LPS O-acetylase OafA/YrhL